MSRFLPVLALITLLEVFILSLLFDIEPLAEQSGLAAFVGSGGGLVPLLFVAPLILVLLKDSTLNDLAGRLARAYVPLGRAVAALLVHLTAFGLYLVATDALLSASAPTDLQVLGWLAAAPLVPGVAWLVARPDARVGPLIRRAAPAMMLGVAMAVFVWGMGTLSARLWHRMNPVVLIPVHALLTATVAGVIYEPEAQNVGTDRFFVHIAPECSGLEGLGLLVSLAAIVVFLRPRQWPWSRAVLLVAGAAVLSWVANIIRIVSLVIIGDAGFEDVAVGGFHSKAGWVLYTLVGLGMLALVSRQEHEAATETSTPVGGADVFIGPVLALTAVGLLTGLVTAGGFDPLYGLRAIAGGWALIVALRAIRRRGLRLADEGSRGAPRVAVAIGVVVYGIWLWLAPGPVSDPLVEGVRSLSGGWAAVWIVTRIVGGVFVVPWVEELAFRGYLHRRLSHEDFTRVPFGEFRAWPVVGSALAFGAVHEAFIAGAIAGVLYSAAMAYGRRVQDAVLAHTVTNALIAIQCFVEWPRP